LIPLIQPFRNTLKNAIIEPLPVPQEKLDELKAVLANPKLPDAHKSFMMSRVSGHCAICGKLPSHIATYRKYGASIIEKYCDRCLELQIKV
jgi:hypothetical protein